MGWGTRTLGEICDEVGGIIRTGPFGSQLHQSDYQDEGLPVVMPKDIVDGRVSVEGIARIGDEDVERLSQHRLKKGDIVYGRRGDIGRRALITQREAGWLCGTGCLRISLGDFVLNPTFLYYYLGEAKVIGWIYNQAIGATMPNLNTSIIRSIPITYPSLPVQRKIAAILSAYDDLIENNTRRIEILEEMARSLYREWFVNFRFPGHEQVKLVDSNSEFGLIPEGWEVVPINELIKRGILEKNQDGNHGEKHPKSTDYVPAGIPFIMAKDLSNNIIDLVNCQFISNEQAQSLRVGFAKKGDVLLTHKATMGRVAIVPQVENFIVLTPQITYFRIKDSSSLNPAFLYCTFTSDRFQDILLGQSEQSTRKFISITNQRNIKILYPSPNWINKFGKIIKDVLGLKEALYLKNTNLRQTRDLLLPKLISGEIDLEEIDIGVYHAENN